MDKPLARGTVVMARWRGYKTWFGGEVIKAYKDKKNGEILVDIKYDDGQIEVKMC
jgi:hypothetical protein